VKKILLLSVVVIALCGCERPPQERLSSSNPEIPVELLFVHDGCKVYRFNDSDRNVYYTNCRGSTMSSYTQFCGKGCVRTVDVSANTEETPAP